MPHAIQTQVAVLGAGGTMGRAMARNLARGGMGVRAWNRTPDKAAALASDGVTVTETAVAAAAGADIVITMLADARAVLAVMDGDGGALAAMSDSALWLQMSTIGEAGTDRCAELAAQRQLGFVDAPVLGTKQPAEQGQLVILASGPGALRDRVQPVFDAVGQRTIWVGETGDGTRLKLVANTWVLAVTEAAAECAALSEGMGLDPARLLEAVQGGPLDLPYLRLKGTAIAERNFEPAFQLRLAAKDAGLVEESANRRDLDLPLVRMLRQRLDEGAERHGEKDLSATYLTSAPPHR
jgi:3-hydroxyisobutyrate dehydrogenase